MEEQKQTNQETMPAESEAQTPPEGAAAQEEAAETKEEKKAPEKKREPNIPDTPSESMEDYKEEIDKSFGHRYEWDKLKEYMEQKTNLKVKIEEVVKGGVLTHVEGMRAFIPASKLALKYIEDSEMASYVGREIEARVVTAEQKGEKLVLSCRDILIDEERAEKKKKIESMKVGTILDGKVESIQAYGAFIDLGDGLSGLLHVSQISNKRVEHPGAVLKKGQDVKVKIIAIKDGKLSLSMKALEEKTVEEKAAEEDSLPHEYSSGGSVGTSLGDLLKNIKL